MNATQRKRLLKLAAALAKVSQELTKLHKAILLETPVAGNAIKTPKAEKGFIFVGEGSLKLMHRAARKGWTLFAYSGNVLIDGWQGDCTSTRYFIRKPV